MKMSPRSQKLAGVLMEKIPTLLQQIFTPDDVGFLTVTAIEVSGDLEVADIFVRSLDGPRGICAKLNTAAGKIAHELLRQVHVRRAIRLRFKPDRGVARAEKIQSLL